MKSVEGNSENPLLCFWSWFEEAQPRSLGRSCDCCRASPKQRLQRCGTARSSQQWAATGAEQPAVSLDSRCTDLWLGSHFYGHVMWWLARVRMHGGGGGEKKGWRGINHLQLKTTNSWRGGGGWGGIAFTLIIWAAFDINQCCWHAFLSSAETLLYKSMQKLNNKMIKTLKAPVYLSLWSRSTNYKHF